MQGCVCVCVCVCVYTLGITSSTVRSKRAVSVGSGAGFTVAIEELGAGLKFGVPCRTCPAVAGLQRRAKYNLGVCWQPRAPQPPAGGGAEPTGAIDLSNGAQCLPFVGHLVPADGWTGHPGPVWMPQSPAGQGFLLPIFRCVGMAAGLRREAGPMVTWLVRGEVLRAGSTPMPPQGARVSLTGSSDLRAVITCFRGLWHHWWQRMVVMITVTPHTASLLGSFRRCRSGLRDCPFYRWAHRGQVTLRNLLQGPSWWWELLWILGSAELHPLSTRNVGQPAPRAQQKPCSERLRASMILHISPFELRACLLSPAPPTGLGHHGTG
ncbi:uncharacterized protein LOC120861800 [Oryx dammah]|uniref:uncharacterized protein LOC120861800 n=1 Tax=Oryx dammah TaxID=59534 RepID=UPI001A9BA79C|nr:uncharacterized protein LOC120861800 [Oryx dammah]